MTAFNELYNSDKELATAFNKSKNITSNDKNVSIVNVKIQSIKNNVVLNYKNYLFFIWIIGIILTFLYVCLGIIKIRKTVHTEIDNNDKIIDDILKDCISIVKLKQEIKIIVSDKIPSPCLIGIVKPVIIIPKHILEKISEYELKHVIIHELCHARRQDVLVAWAAAFLEIVYWFNPIILFGLNRMRKDCEIACDAAVLSYFGKEERQSYGNTIINVLNLINKNIWIPGTTSMAVKKSDLKKRISMIAGNSKITVKRLVFGVVTILLIVMVGLTDGLHNGKNLKTADDLVKELKSRKYTIESVEDVLDRRARWFSGNQKFIKASNAELAVFEFNNEQEAINEASKVSKDGFSITAPSNEDRYGNTPYYVAYLSWGDNPHFYRSGNLIVIYSGANLKVQYDLKNILGSQFAGYKWYIPGRKQLINIFSILG
jgi:beta-lactamase regulating signal transducer with metallopeptidase domain